MSYPWSCLCGQTISGNGPILTTLLKNPTKVCLCRESNDSPDSIYLCCYGMNRKWGPHPCDWSCLQSFCNGWCCMRFGSSQYGVRWIAWTLVLFQLMSSNLTSLLDSKLGRDQYMSLNLFLEMGLCLNSLLVFNLCESRILYIWSLTWHGDTLQQYSGFSSRPLQ